MFDGLGGMQSDLGDLRIDLKQFSSLKGVLSFIKNELDYVTLRCVGGGLSDS